MPTPRTFKLTAKQNHTRMVGIFTVYYVLGDVGLCLWCKSWEAPQVFRSKLPRQLSAVLPFLSVHHAVAFTAYPCVTPVSSSLSNGKLHYELLVFCHFRLFR
jgi:hypothetical protein